jgi:uncharacterized protein
MSAPATELATRTASQEGMKRISEVDWARVTQDLDARGSAVLRHLISPDQCETLANLYSDDSVFRSRVVMARPWLWPG